MRANMLRLFDAVNRGLPLPLGGVRNRRSLVFTGNVVAAIERLLETPAAGGEVFFVRDPADVSTPDLIRAIARALGRPARLVPVPAPLFRAAGAVGDLLAPWVKVPVSTPAVVRLFGSLAVDASKLARVTGFEPPFSLAEGLRITAEWYRRRPAGRG
jgi:nucleoside-diphosphate-sugar epimerase